MPNVAVTSAGASADAIFISIEMSRSKWLVGAHSPLSDKISLHAIDWGDTIALFAIIERLRGKATEVFGNEPAVLCCYEAGYEGFWLHRVLIAAGYQSIVIDPASLLVNRRAKRAKTDRIDARAMIRALIAFNRGEDQVLRAVHVPSVEQDDARRLMRERQRLVKERTAHTNRIKGLLITQGIVDFDARAGAAELELERLVTGDGRPLGPRMMDELRREIGRLRLSMEQLAAVDAERNAVASDKRRSPDQAIDEGVDTDAPMIVALARIRGIGPNDASVLVREAFWRKLNNRREIAAWSGFAPAPWSSGTINRDQGITKAGPAHFRAYMIQLSWRWLQWQQESRLAQWFNERTAGSSGRVRRIMIVALARKLMVALWRYATTGLVPTGAVVT